jgi:hypothetical protein
MAEPTTAGAASASPPSPPPGGKQALFEAAQEVLRKQADERRAQLEAERRARSRISPIVAVGCAIVLVLLAYVAVERPTWLFPKPPVPESAEVQEASLRIGMASVAQRVEKFRDTRKRLPRSLAETGGSLQGIKYERHDSLTYTIHGTHGPHALTLRSTDSLRTFLSGSFEVIARRSGR